MKVDADARNGYGKSEVVVRLDCSLGVDAACAAVHQVARGMQRDVDHFGSGVECSEHETFGQVAGLNRTQMEGLRSEELVHPAICAVSRDQLEWNREQQR